MIPPLDHAPRAPALGLCVECDCAPAVRYVAFGGRPFPMCDVCARVWSVPRPRAWRARLAGALRRLADALDGGRP